MGGRMRFGSDPPDVPRGTADPSCSSDAGQRIGRPTQASVGIGANPLAGGCRAGASCRRVPDRALSSALGAGRGRTAGSRCPVAGAIRCPVGCVLSESPGPSLSTIMRGWRRASPVMNGVHSVVCQACGPGGRCQPAIALRARGFSPSRRRCASGCPGTESGSLNLPRTPCVRVRSAARGSSIGSCPRVRARQGATARPVPHS